jgi:hypothetical protein
MVQRKYFKHRIADLELIYSQANGNIALLEELEEELVERDTRRAKRLLELVRKSLEATNGAAKAKASGNSALLGALEEELVERDSQRANRLLEPVRKSLEATNDSSSATANVLPTTPSPPRAEVQAAQIAKAPIVLPVGECTPIDWQEFISGVAEEHANSGLPIAAAPLVSSAQSIIDTWTALEALSPQTYKRPDDLVIGTGSVAYFRNGEEPWLTGERSRPKHNLFYLVYLGAIDLEQATEKLLKKYQDKRVERPSSRGLAALGVVLLDKKGIPVPETGLTLSSFGWAYARALEGNLHVLKYWERAEAVLKVGLEKYIYRKDEDGNDLPFTFAQAESAFQWLLGNCQIPKQDAAAPDFAIRLYQSFSRGGPESPLLNSFFLDDLQRARSALGTPIVGKALSQYLGLVKPSNQHDLLKHKSHIEFALQPKNTPPSRWPGQGRFPLVLLQQTAINLAMLELKESGLVSVNGPPGTGKTTLLRDIVAAVVVKRAQAMCAFQNPEDAFEHSGQMKLGNGFVHLYKLHKTLRGHEIVVASTNNKAVENVSRELPQRSQISADLTALNYFKTVSDALSGSVGETWGLIAAVLGNSANRSAYINKAWWDDDTGLRKYFLSITGQIDLQPDENGETHIPRVVSECDPPRNAEDARQRWDATRRKFVATLKKSEAAIEDAQHAYECHQAALQIKADLDRNLARQAEHRSRMDALRTKSDGLAAQRKEREVALSGLKNNEASALRAKPRLFKRLFARQEWKEWKASHAKIKSALGDVHKFLARLLDEANAVSKLLQKEEHELSILVERKKDSERKIFEHLVEIKKAAEVCGDKLVTPALWRLSHDEQQTFAPNFTARAQRLRDDVFVAALELHKAFIDASAKPMRQNLGAYFHALNGGRIPADKQSLLPHLWSSAFILTSVVSTAFASVGRMLKALPSESIGWLLIDEAGQATPQAAVGAIYRAKRVVSVGDPLQIEPVVTLPASLAEGIARHLGVESEHWVAPAASVQSLSDNANAYGTTIPRDLSEIRIGMPLLVHRRCENPMFGISNALAYAGLMVHATSQKSSPITELFGAQVRWIDVSGSSQEKWCPEEGEKVADLLLKGCAAFKGDPGIFVITPFRVVAERMRRRMHQDADALRQSGIDNPDAWIAENIGTVHTFQGKEARGVVLLLGAPDPAQGGARNWATSNVNLLNVAVSRAKQNFYVVGNRSLWGNLGHMKLISKYLPS